MAEACETGGCASMSVGDYLGKAVSVPAWLWDHFDGDCNGEPERRGGYDLLWHRDVPDTS
ncbi:MAG: hypothetical protein WBX25_07325 [Rhodomicrobium sp.]